MNLIDTHAHLNFPELKPDLDEILKRAKEAGITRIINVGVNIKQSQEVLEQALDLSTPDLQIYSTIGFHPEESSTVNNVESINQHLSKLETIYQSNPQKVVGVGECGLDYFKHEGQITEEEKQAQKTLFQAQIDLARNLNLPLIVHCRDAWQEIFDFDYSEIKGVFHSFTSNLEDAQKVLGLGFYLSFSCIVTYPKNDCLREVIKNIPLEKILTETDCPFLPPQSQRGQRNEPSNILEIIKTIADLKNISLEEVTQTTFQNTQNLFSFT